MKPNIYYKSSVYQRIYLLYSLIIITNIWIRVSKNHSKYSEAKIT